MAKPKPVQKKVKVVVDVEIRCASIEIEMFEDEANAFIDKIEAANGDDLHIDELPGSGNINWDDVINNGDPRILDANIYRGR